MLYVAHLDTGVNVFLSQRPQPAPEPEPDNPDALTPDEAHAMGAFEDLGFHPFEAFTLVTRGLSPSAVREFCRHHSCDPRTAVAILL